MTSSQTPSAPTPPVRSEWIEKLVGEHEAFLDRIAAARVGPSLAADVVSEVFAIAWQQRATFDAERGSERSWLVGITVNRCERHTRAERRWLARQQRLGARYASRPHDATSDIDGRLDATAVAARLWAGMARLTRDERTVMLLVAHAGMTPSEVAAAIEVPPATVRSRLLRARRQLASELSIDLEGADT